MASGFTMTVDLRFPPVVSSISALSCWLIRIEVDAIGRDDIRLNASALVRETTGGAMEMEASAKKELVPWSIAQPVCGSIPRGCAAWDLSTMLHRFRASIFFPSFAMAISHRARAFCFFTERTLSRPLPLVLSGEMVESPTIDAEWSRMDDSASGSVLSCFTRACTICRSLSTKASATKRISSVGSMQADGTRMMRSQNEALGAHSSTKSFITFPLAAGGNDP
mmetsp:Transcript_7660/g.25348  ORF Transcript_7660/g.25348 Transcript_7660/m.25348 type:complete len:223 (-) Transcript_7660:155-823(-)